MPLGEWDAWPADEFCAARGLKGMARNGETMGVVFLALSMSLDGYVAGPDDDVEPLHRWLFNGDPRAATATA